MSTPSTSNSTPTTTNKTSLIWNFFTIYNNSKAICKICELSFTVKFQNRKSWDVSNLHKHMKQKHSNIEVGIYKAKNSPKCIYCSKEIFSILLTYSHFKPKIVQWLNSITTTTGH